MEKITVWGVAFILALAMSYGNAEVSSSEAIDKAVLEKVANETSLGKTSGIIVQPAATEEGTGSVSQVAERRMSLYDFFFNDKNNNNNNNERNSELQTPTLIPGQQQVKVQQNPNQLMFVRETTFPNPNGGLLSRLILARRMARLQRLSNRLQVLPSMFGLFQRQQAAQRTLNQRIGGQWQPEYNPADIMSDGIGFKNASVVTPHRQYSPARLNQNLANDMSFSQNQGQSRFADNNFYAINDVPNQPYPQTHSSLEEFERFKGNFGLRQNIAAFEQQARNKENIYNQQQAIPDQQQQQLKQQQAAYEQQIRNQEKSYEQQQQLNQQQQQPQLSQQHQQHYDQEQQQLKYQQQLLEHQEQLRKQQQQLYEQHQQSLRQQQLYDQQQQQLKEQLEQYEKQQQQQQQQTQQKQATPQNYEQKASPQLYDQQQLKIQQDLFEQQTQLKQLLLDQQQKLQQQDERFQQLQKQLIQDQKEPAQQKNSNQARDSSYYGATGNVAHAGNSGVLDYGGPAAYDVGVEINADPYKGQIGGHKYSNAGTVDSNIGHIDKTSEEKPIAIGYKPAASSSGWRLPLFPLGIFPRPLFNLNGKVFFGAELGRNAGIKSGGWK